jgi:hypothetical protein
MPHIIADHPSFIAIIIIIATALHWCIGTIKEDLWGILQKIGSNSGYPFN